MSQNQLHGGTKDGIPVFHAASRTDWRNWLKDNHETEKAVWLILYKKGSGIPSTNYAEAVEEALCFGWIDSKANKRDTQSRYQYFARRNPKSNWSKLNKERVKKLIDLGLMEAAGSAMIEIAKKNGTWTALDEVERLMVPEDLQKEFDKNPISFAHWDKFPRSVKRGILEWILTAKKPETRGKRIYETVTLAAQNIRANQSKA